MFPIVINLLHLGTSFLIISLNFSKINIHIQNIREYQSKFVLIQTDVIWFITDSCQKYEKRIVNTKCNGVSYLICKVPGK